MNAFSFWSTFKSVFKSMRFQRISAHRRPKRIERYAFSNDSALVWTGPETIGPWILTRLIFRLRIFNLTKCCRLGLHCRRFFWIHNCFRIYCTYSIQIRRCLQKLVNPRTFIQIERYLRTGDQTVKRIRGTNMINPEKSPLLWTLS